MAITWGYVAGFLDGDGSLGIYGRPKRANINVRLINSCEELLLQIKKWLIEQNVYSTIPSPTKKPKCKPLFRLCINDRKSQQIFLENIVPFLLMPQKQRKAIEILEWFKQHSPYHINKPERMKNGLFRRFVRCGKCGRYLFKDHFRKNVTDVYGISDYCKTCAKQYDKEWNRKRREKY